MIDLSEEELREKTKAVLNGLCGGYSEEGVDKLLESRIFRLYIEAKVGQDGA